MWRNWVACLAVWFGCVSTRTVTCEDGTVCPAATYCAVVMGETRCATPDQLAACAGQAAFASCGESQRCYDGVCLPSGCGNALVDPGEVCDDGNNGAADGCSADCASNETCGNGVVDVIGEEQCDLGGLDTALSHDGCSSACRGEQPRWTVIPAFSDLTSLAVAYDAKRDQIVAFGSTGQVATTWTTTAGGRWSLRRPAVSPLARDGAAMAFDAARERIVLFGGDGFDDTWEWDGVTWILRSPSISPPARNHHAMAYDARGKRVIMFGGVDGLMPAQRRADTWAWDGHDWTPIVSPQAPSARSHTALAFDPRRGVVTLFGGQVDASEELGDTWELDGTTWRLLDDRADLQRGKHALGFDAASGRMIMHGGSNSGVRGDAWAWDGTTWTELAGIGGPAVSGHALIARSRTGELALVSRGAIYRWSRSWVLTNPSEQVTTLARSGHAAAMDPIERRLVVHGGFTPNGTEDTTLLWSGSWSRHAGITPGAVSFAGMTYDVARRQVVLFGGFANGVATNATWVFEDGAWRDATPVTTSPPARFGHVLIYDAARARVVLHGGRDGAALGDTWTWDGAAWTQAEAPGGPSPREGAAAAYDPVREVVVLFGGQADFTSPPLRDTWEWDGTTWTERMVAGPGGRSYAASAWDASRRRVVLFGGTTGSGGQNDQWEWDGVTWAQIPVVVALSPRSNHTMVSTLDGRGVFAFGGAALGDASGDFAALSWGGAGPIEACTADDVDGDGLAGCGATGDPDCWYACTPTCPPGATSPSSCGAAAPGCGDGACDVARESCMTCAMDCGACPLTCGDLRCDPPELPTTCPGDC